jgi:hypothetical protein
MEARGTTDLPRPVRAGEGVADSFHGAARTADRLDVDVDVEVWLEELDTLFDADSEPLLDCIATKARGAHRDGKSTSRGAGVNTQAHRRATMQGLRFSARGWHAIDHRSAKKLVAARPCRPSSPTRSPRTDVAETEELGV